MDASTDEDTCGTVYDLGCRWKKEGNRPQWQLDAAALLEDGTQQFPTSMFLSSIRNWVVSFENHSVSMIADDYP